MITLWRVLCVLSIILFLAGLIAMLCLRLLKNKYYREYQEDELMKKEKTLNSENSIFFTSGETKKYIKKYVVCQTTYDQYLVCNFAKRFSEIVFFVVEYDKKQRVISVKRVEELHTGETSKVIALSRRTKAVNVVVGAVEGAEINSDIIRPLSLTKIRLYALLKSITVFMGLFVVRHFLIEIFGGPITKYYFADLMNYISVIACVVFGVVSYFITVASFRKRNVKALNGGALEYEFI